MIRASIYGIAFDGRFPVLHAVRIDQMFQDMETLSKEVRNIAQGECLDFCGLLIVVNDQPFIYPLRSFQP